MIKWFVRLWASLTSLVQIIRGYLVDSTSKSRFSILTIEQKRRTAALYARRLNMAAFPLVGKVPAESERWLSYTRSAGAFGSDAAWARATGYALAPIMGGCRAIIDIDDIEAASALIMVLATLKFTFAVTSGRGIHYYVDLAKPINGIHKLGTDHEIASLRGHGAYVAGPGSDHADGSVYTANSQQVLSLQALTTQMLFGVFGLNAPEARLQPRHDPTYQVPGEKGRQAIAAALFDRGGKVRTDHNGETWINCTGACPQVEQHKSGVDEHVSFGFNADRGYAKCFACDRYFTMKQLARALHVDLVVHGGVFGDKLPALAVRDGMVQRRGPLTQKGGTLRARIADLLKADERLTVSRADLLELGCGLGWRRATVDAAIQQALHSGLLRRVGNGMYWRMGECVPLPFERAHYTAAVPYRRAVLLRTERDLAATDKRSHATAYIAYRSGFSRRTVYNYEAALHIDRVQLFQRSAASCKTGDFPKGGGHWFEALDAKTRATIGLYPADADGLQAVYELARRRPRLIVAQLSQRPSIRVLPGESVCLPRGARLLNSGRAIIDVLEAERPSKKSGGGGRAWSTFYDTKVRSTDQSNATHCVQNTSNFGGLKAS